MGDPKGFIAHQRTDAGYRDIDQRMGDWREVNADPLPVAELRKQGARCMDCGIPFCHGPTGCPLGNLIPVFNDLTHRDKLAEALRQLHATNNFPEFTGRICPAPCETACVLGINELPVTIKQIEYSIIDRAWEAGLVRPEPPKARTGKRVAIVGSGPAGLAAAQQLNRAGHEVTVYERDDRIGGLLTYGIPDFKLEKRQVERRVEQMEAEGITFKTNADVGVNVDPHNLLKTFDAIVLATGATQPRDLPIPGRDLDGVHFAMKFLTLNNKRVAGDEIPDEEFISAKDKHVVIIGGGDTGSDCIGTSVRQGAKSITQLEILPRPTDERTDEHPWPYWPFTMSTSTSQQEAKHKAGGERQWSVNTSHFSGTNGRVKKLHTEQIGWETVPGQRPKMIKVAGSETVLDADLVLLAMGFLHPEQPLIEQWEIKTDDRGNAQATLEHMQTNVAKIFAAGDCRRGQSLVVWALAEGRDVARDIDEYLMGHSELPRSHPRASGVIV